MSASTAQATVNANDLKKGTFSYKLFDVLTARNNEVHSGDTDTSLGLVKRAHKALDAVMTRPEFKEIAPELLKRARIADKKQNPRDYVAVNVVQKIIYLCEALHTGLSDQLDPYTKCIAGNLCKLNGITNKTNMVALSKSVEYDATEQTQHISKRYNCSVGTAGAQAAQVRMVMLYMGICDVVKGKRADVMTLQANDRARSLVALFSDKVIAEATEAEAA